jgi:hypothetical protein
MPENQSKFRGNPRHLTLLIDAVNRGDIAGWNTACGKKGTVFRPRLAGADLSGLAMGEVRLESADLTDADLTGTNLARANLSNARMRGCRLIGANLSGARLNHANLAGADLKMANLTNCQARGAVFTGADLSGAKIEGADLRDASMKGAAITGTSRSGAKMKVKVKATPGMGGVTGRGPRPWVRALDEETGLKEQRKILEESKSRSDKELLDRKLGRRKPLFNRVK